MYRAFEVDYTDRCFLLGEFRTVKEALKAEREALKRSRGAFPTFTSDGKRCISNNGKLIID